LIDGDSASASEIFAGAIKDSGRGKVVGSRSYGKGSVQGIFPLGKNGAGARLTTARFFSPLGHPISNVGITPDVDTRGPATSMANGNTPGPHLVAFGAKEEGQRTATNTGAANTGTSVTVNNIGADRDEVLDIAVDVVRQLPVAAL
jgi:C-terminal processing protease CtpA/Prc